MSFLSFEMTELDQNIFDTVILEHPVYVSVIVENQSLLKMTSHC